MSAKKLIEAYVKLGINEGDDEARAGVVSLISQIARQGAVEGIEVGAVYIDQEDQLVSVEIMAGGKPVMFYFFADDGMPKMGVDWDNDDDVDAEFDISGLEPKLTDDGLVDVASIASWMPAEVFQDILFNPMEEEQSVDDWERTGQADDGSSVSEAKKRPKSLGKMKKIKKAK